MKNVERIGMAVLGAALMLGSFGCKESASDPVASAEPAKTVDAAGTAELEAMKAQIAELESQLTRASTSDAASERVKVLEDEINTLRGRIGMPELVQTRGVGSMIDAAGSASSRQVSPSRAATTAPVDGNARKLAEIERLSQTGDLSFVKVTPVALELGIIPTGEAGSGTVTLQNMSDVPQVLQECKTSCGCTAARCPKNHTLQPGESVEVEVRLDGGDAEKKIKKTVTFLFQDQAPVRMDVIGESVAFVKAEPAEIGHDTHPEGKLVLRSIDDQPFTIKSMYPPILESFDETPAVEHVINIPWEEWATKANRNRKLLFAVDHPRCQKVHAMVSIASVQWAQKTTGDAPVPIAAAPAGSPTSAINLDQLLKNGQHDRALALVKDGTLAPDAVLNGGKSPLTVASENGASDLVRLLLDESADIEAVDGTGRTPLMYAAQSKNLDTVRELLDAGADIRARDQIGNTALCWAAAFGDSDTVLELIDAGAGVDVAGTATGFTPLIWASGFGEVGSVKALIDAGADLEARDAFEKATPLMYAARTNEKENLSALIEAGADLESTDAIGKTTLLMAASNGGADAEMVQLIIDAGANIEARSANGKNALDWANDRTDPRSEEVIDVLAALMELTATPAIPVPAVEEEG